MTNLKRKDYYGKCGVYRIYSTIDIRCYIGSTNNLYKRINAHINQLKTGKHSNTKLLNFYNKYGDKLEIEVLEVCDELDLEIKENHYREHYDSVKEGFDVLENSYSPRGHKYSDEHKSNLSKIHKANLSKNLPQLMKNLDEARKVKTTGNKWNGKIHKESSKLLMSKAKLGKPSKNKGKKLPNIGKAKLKAIYSISEDGIRTDYSSAKEAEELTGICRKTISTRIRAKRVAKDGSQWFFT